MFKSEKDVAYSMGCGRIYRVDKTICKYDPECLRGESPYSPFICNTNNTKWRPMSSLWEKYADMVELFKDRPDLEIGTKVLVKPEGEDKWVERRFKRWLPDATISCIDDTINSLWWYWEVAEGKFEGETNFRIIEKRFEGETKFQGKEVDLHLRPEYFKRTCSSGDGTPVYRIRLEYLGVADKQRALDITHQAGGKVSSYDQDYAEFESADLKVLCNTLNSLSNSK